MSFRSLLEKPPTSASATRNGSLCFTVSGTHRPLHYPERRYPSGSR